MLLHGLGGLLGSLPGLVLACELVEEAAVVLPSDDLAGHQPLQKQAASLNTLPSYADASVHAHNPAVQATCEQIARV